MGNSLREVVEAAKEHPWYAQHERDINFELNHLELHDQDDYLLTMLKAGIKAEDNPNNSNLAFLLGITDVEPTGRIYTVGGSFPDIDLDFEKDRRDEVKQHLVDRYGADKVASIGTFMFPKPKGLWKDIARLYDLDFNRSNEISKLIPDDPDLKDFTQALEDSKDLKKLYDTDPKVREIIEYARNLEGTVKTVGIHACGMCISVDPLTDTIPLFSSKDGAVTQFDGETLEKVGLIKYDILGLKNLSAISKTFELIKKVHGKDISVADILPDDPEAYKIIGSGESYGVFQIEGSQGLRDFAAAAKPTNLTEMAAVISLYRPGPMGMDAHLDYVARKNGKQASSFPIPEYDYIFKETYGLLVFQEQLMILAKDMCGFNDIEADVLRKAVGKKDRDLLLAQKERFVSGAVANGQDRLKISHLFDEMEEFARYCFNKSHAICYAEIGYQTAWLKAYYPSEFLAAVIAFEDSIEGQSVYIEDARRSGISVLPPDINRSTKDFTVAKNGDILFGFNQIKGVGGRAINKVLSIAPSTSFGDFLIKSYHAKGINKKIIEALIQCGACDSFGYKRSCMIKSFENFLATYVRLLGGTDDKEKIKEVRKRLLEAEERLFNDPNQAEYPLLRILDMEKTLLGIHISGNPFDIVATIVEEDFYNIEDFADRNGQGYILGQINKIKKTLTKAEKKEMCFIDVTDSIGGHTSFVVFPTTYAKYKHCIDEGNYVLIMTRTETKGGKKSYFADAIRDITSEVDSVSDKIEAEKEMKAIDIHFKEPPGTVRIKTICNAISEFVVEEDSGFKMTLCVDIGDAVFKIKRFNSKRIDIPMLRSLGRHADIYVSRGT